MNAPTGSLASLRQEYSIQQPAALANIEQAQLDVEVGQPPETPLPEHFPKTQGKHILKVVGDGEIKGSCPKIGVVLSGGQAAGGHNVIIGLHDALMRRHGQAHLIGFLGGPSGIINNAFVTLSADLLDSYRNQGGFDMIGSGRTKIETPKQFAAAKKNVLDQQLDGLIVIGGDDSNTNAALLAEFFAQENVPCSVVGVPKTIDGDLKTEDVELSFGFDTACKTFSEIIGNIARDALSAKKYYHFIKLMGRSASHVTLECALQTQVNVALIGEELAAKHTTLSQLTQQIADIIVARSEAGKDYGVILIPEGIIEFLPETEVMIAELNALLAQQKDAFEHATTAEAQLAFALKHLTAAAASSLQAMPTRIQQQLMLVRDPHGNVQVSKIETERLLIAAVKEELHKRKKAGDYQGTFNAQPHFLGYEGRSCLPSNFDANYCYSLGSIAALLVEHKATGYIAAVRGLARPVNEWQACAIPLSSFIHLETRKGKSKPVIKKALVDLEGPVFQHFKEQRQKWAVNDSYLYPGPIQFFGPKEITDRVPRSLELEHNISSVVY